MIKAVLLDLDDTLLGNPTQRFVENYIGALDRFISERLDIPAISRPLLAGIREVIGNLDPARTNWDVFYDALNPLLTVAPEAFNEAVAEFYRTTYPGLRAGTEVRAWARPLVHWLLERGYKVVVATNPFFPRVAIEQRLAWADVPADEFPFALITTLENMHFSKPHPHYYEEILARIGVQADEALMVGDDWQNDIVPAYRAGLNTYWICAGPLPEVSAVRPDGFGSADEFAQGVMDRHWLDTLRPRPHTPAQIIPRLTANLAALLGAAKQIPPHVWPMQPDPNEWTPVEVVCHLYESEREVQRPRLQTILREDNPFLSAPPPPPAPRSRECPSDGWQVALAFAAERQITLDFLAGLDDSAWSRPAWHSIFGPTTFLEMANFTAQHDRLHITQLCQTVGQCE